MSNSNGGGCRCNGGRGMAGCPGGERCHSWAVVANVSLRPPGAVMAIAGQQAQSPIHDVATDEEREAAVCFYGKPFVDIAATELAVFLMRRRANPYVGAAGWRATRR